MQSAGRRWTCRWNDEFALLRRIWKISGCILHLLHPSDHSEMQHAAEVLLEPER
jgi:hypothetical protein